MKDDVGFISVEPAVGDVAGVASNLTLLFRDEFSQVFFDFSWPVFSRRANSSLE
jgi:hypothetical protein